MSILAKAAPFLSFRTPFSSARRSNTGSIILQGPQVSLVKNATAARCVFTKLLNDAVLVMICTGAVSVCVAAAPGVAPPAACEATVCSIDAASWELEAAAGVGAGAVGMAPGVGRLYIASIVGRNAAPNGVARKSVGRSERHSQLEGSITSVVFLPLINEGILPPVRNPTTSSVNELQLNSAIIVSIYLD
jgi:hypothetical protein